jgi:hypothetical protein
LRAIKQATQTLNQTLFFSDSNALFSTHSQAGSTANRHETPVLKTFHAILEKLWRTVWTSFGRNKLFEMSFLS